jgi:hypothetical protein
LESDDVLIEIDEINVFEESFDNDFDINLPATKKTKVNYNYTCKFQIKWVAKLNWAKGMLVEDEIPHNVKCKVCNIIKRRPKLVVFK